MCVYIYSTIVHARLGLAKPDRVGPCVELKKLKKLKNKPEVTRWGKKKSTKSTKFLWSAFFSSIVSSVDTGAVPWHSTG